MYPIVSLASLLVRIYIYCHTIETTPVFANGSIEWIVGHVIPIHSVLWFVSYTAVGIFYERGSNPALGAALYAAIYMPLLFVVWGILWILTVINVLPI